MELSIFCRCKDYDIYVKLSFLILKKKRRFEKKILFILVSRNMKQYGFYETQILSSLSNSFQASGFKFLFKCNFDFNKVYGRKYFLVFYLFIYLFIFVNPLA